MSHWTDKLIALYACSEAVEWAQDYDSLAAAWAACPRGDWLLWLAGRLSGPPWSDSRRPLVRAAAQCAELALPYIKDGLVEGVVRATLQTCVAWSEGEASDEEMRAAAHAAAAAADAADADAAADDDATAAAAAAAADAADASADAAASAASSAADAAAAYAADAAASAAYAARSRILAQCADIVRANLDCPVLR